MLQGLASLLRIGLILKTVAAAQRNWAHLWSPLRVLIVWKRCCGRLRAYRFLRYSLARYNSGCFVVSERLWQAILPFRA
jgi:hypothetical protein